jgi:hypothetical protein
MAVPTRITDFSTTAGNNSPSGSESVGTSLDDYLRGIQATTRLDLASVGADIASAATTDLGAVGGLVHSITGTTTITSHGTVAAGVHKILVFAGSLTYTHNATSLILPGAANITTAAGDVAWVVSLGSGNWRCLSYVPATGYSVKQFPASDTAAGAIEYAIQSEMETATSTTLAVTPGRLQYHPGVPKAWVAFNGTGTPSILASHNVSSITDNGTGNYTVNFTTAFSSGNYAVSGVVEQSGDGVSAARVVGPAASGTRSTTACQIYTKSGSSLEDYAYVSVSFYGDQ